MIKKLRPFVIAFIAVFTMVALQFILHKIDRPLIKTPHFELSQQKINDFQIKKGQGLIQPAYAGEGYNQAAAFAVVDTNNGQVVMEKNLSQRLPMASLTKMMTAIVVLDLTEAADHFTVSEAAANIQPTRMGLVPQQVWDRDELLNAMLLTSANDVAEVFKGTIDQKYGSGAFVKAMNEKAKFLGLKNTHFENPQGFDGNSHFSSVEDLATIANYGLRNYPLFKEIVGKDYQFYPAAQTHKQADLYNWNGLLGVYPGVSGVKIGNTDKAGYCIVVVSERAGKKLMAIVLGAPGVLERDLWASQILDAGFQKLAGLTPIQVTTGQLKAKYATWQYFQ